MAGKQPAFQFYPGDWLRDPELRICSFQAKGVWMDALCLAFACSERGVFSSNGRPWSREQLAAAVGCGVEVIDELINNGVARIREQDGAIYCARMVKDEEIRQSKAAAGSKGGSKRQANVKQTPKQNASKTQAEGQAKTGSSSSSSTSIRSSDLDPPLTPPGGNGEKPASSGTIEVDDLTFPDSLNNPTARKAAADWLAYKRKRKQPYKAADHMNRLLAEFARDGTELFVSSVNFSIGRNYQGLIPDKSRSRATGDRLGPGQVYDPNAEQKDPKHGQW